MAVRFFMRYELEKGLRAVCILSVFLADRHFILPSLELLHIRHNHMQGHPNYRNSNLIESLAFEFDSGPRSKTSKLPSFVHKNPKLSKIYESTTSWLWHSIGDNLHKDDDLDNDDAVGEIFFVCIGLPPKRRQRRHRRRNQKAAAGKLLKCWSMIIFMFFVPLVQLVFACELKWQWYALCTWSPLRFYL